MAYSLLEITDGTYANTVTLISEQFGVHLKEWNPSLPPFKSGGIFQSSFLAGGSRPVIAEFDDAIENFSLVVNGPGQDATIGQIQDLIRILQEAISYWLTGKGKPIYIRAKSPCETGIRYAHIKFYGIPDVDNPYASPFFVGRKLAAMDDFNLSVTRGHWLANPPGVGECLTIGNVQEWLYQGYWVLSQGSITPDSFLRMLELANGTILAGGGLDMYRSTDNGDTWGTISYPLGFSSTVSMVQLSNGTIILGGAGNTCISTDNGASFGTVVTIVGAAAVWDLANVGGSTALAITDIGLYRSTDGGASWSVIASAQAGLSVEVDGNGYYYNSSGNTIYRSVDAGITWGGVFSFSSSSNPALFRLVDDIITVVAYPGLIMRLIKLDHTTGIWSIVSTIDTLASIANSGRVWARGNTFFYWIQDGLSNNYLYKSLDGGITWDLDLTGASGFFDGLVTASGFNFVIEGDTILRYDDTLIAEMGASDSCDGELYLSNKISDANLTHVKIDDGGVFTDIFPITSFPQDLLPAVPAANDAIYFGIDTSIINTGPFASLVFDLVPLTFTSSYTITWEFWSGAAWSALTVTDNTNQAGAFTRSGIASVHWDQPSNWATTAVDSVTGYWVRARVSALVGTITPPEQQNRQIYSVVLPFLAVDDTEVLGDIPALARYQLVNRSDKDGRGGSAPDLWDNRVIAGLRSFVSTSFFQAYINISDEQEPYGISVSVGTNTSFAADVTTPTGRRATYNPGGVEAMATRVTITLGPSIARDFYGVFHAYVRARRTAGASTDLTLRLQVVTGSGGITFTSENVQLQGTTAFELLDFGQVELPVSGGIMDTELPDVTQLNIQASAESGTPDLYLYDLILIPVDEWAIDAVDFVNSADSVIGQVDAAVYRLLDVDSIAFPLLDIRSLVRQDDTNQLIVAAYDPITNGEAIAQNNIDQRLWILCAQTAATGADPVWIAPPAIAHSVKAYKNERWLALRGDEV